MTKRLIVSIITIVLLEQAAGLSYALRPAATDKVREVIDRLASRMRQGQRYTIADAKDLSAIRKLEEKAPLHVNTQLRKRYEELKDNGGKVYFREKKTWNDAYVWLQILRQLQAINGAKPQSILEVGPGYDPTLAITAEALGFEGRYSWLDRSKKVGETLKSEIVAKNIGKFEKELISEDIFTFVEVGRRFDLLLFKHFFDDLFLGMHVKGYGKLQDWSDAIAKEDEYTRRIIAGVISKLPNLLNPGGMIVINEYPARPKYKAGRTGPENLRERLVAKILEGLRANPDIEEITGKIDFPKIDGSPISLFPDSFHVFIAKPRPRICDEKMPGAFPTPYQPAALAAQAIYCAA